MSDTSVNFTKLEEMKDVMGEIFIQLVPAYLEQSDEMIAEMPDLLSNGDLETLERHAHSMKSSSLNVGAERLGKIACELEDISRSSGNTDILSEKIDAITDEYMKVKMQLQGYLQSN
jgi:histidine phosphotransfer protein HptB